MLGMMTLLCRVGALLELRLRQRRENRPAALRRTTLAAVDTEFIVGRFAAVARVRVIVDELFARLNLANRLDEDASPLDRPFAVRVARVIDEARFVAAEGAVDHDRAVHGKQKRVMPLLRVVVIARVGDGVRDTLAEILDQSLALHDAANREATATGDFRRLRLERLLGNRLHRTARHPISRPK
jgi:hypothetical protein